jgi:hypothetical protein
MGGRRLRGSTGLICVAKLLEACNIQDSFATRLRASLNISEIGSECGPNLIAIGLRMNIGKKRDGDATEDRGATM